MWKLLILAEDVDQTHGMFQMCLRMSMCTCVFTHVVYMHVSALNILPWATLRLKAEALPFPSRSRRMSAQKDNAENTFFLCIAMDTMFDKPFHTEG